MAACLLDRHVEAGDGDRVALRLRERTVTYGELQQLTNRVGNALRELGVRAEERVALHLPDCAEFVATFLGAMKIGAVPVPLNTAAPPDDLVFFLTDSRARVLVTTAESGVSALNSSATGAPPSLQAVLIVGSNSASCPRATSFEEAVAANSAELEAAPTSADEPSYWLYSSGTTGRPKGVVHLHGDMLPCVVPYAEDVLDMQPDDRALSVARLFFSYGLVNSLYLPLLTGA